MKNIFMHLEARIQNLIEGSAARLLPTSIEQRSLAENFTQAIRGSIQTGRHGELIAPNLFYLHINPAQAELFRSDPDVLNEIARYIHQAGDDSGLVFLSQPVIRVVENPNMKQGEVNIVAENSLDDQSETMDFPIDDDLVDVKVPPGAFLIVNGMQVFQLQECIVNIGRRHDNHLVVNDQRVSRLHAQLRVIGQRFMIFDLDSSGGTFVNGLRVQKSVLRPGDVISLSGLPLVYGQDSVEPGDTQKYAISSFDDAD
ncbi:MAG: FhaA domain-containing protein [Chloroflexota bacterium]|nr:FhaA domain-containing protein [Chloroflexota bacterium]